MNIWQNLPKGFTILAPMEGVTDVVFRQVIDKAGRPDLFYTEFTNVTSYASDKGRHDALERLTVCEKDAPIIAQIWGKVPEHFALIARELEGLGFQGLDINMACPDRHVNKAGGGAAMIRTPELAISCIEEAKKNTNLPVSVKTRLGFTYVDEYKDWLPVVLKQQVANLTIHLRTRKEMSKVPAHFDLIPEILKLRDEIAPETKLTINGDIMNCRQVQKLRQQYPEVDGFMIGRGVFFNPYCFTERVQVSRGGDVSVLELMELFKYHLDCFDKRKVELEMAGSRYPFEPLKRMFKVYINSFDGASNLRVKLMDCKNTDELRIVIDEFLAQVVD